MCAPPPPASVFSQSGAVRAGVAPMPSSPRRNKESEARRIADCLAARPAGGGRSRAARAGDGGAGGVQAALANLLCPRPPPAAHFPFRVSRQLPGRGGRAGPGAPAGGVRAGGGSRGAGGAARGALTLRRRRRRRGRSRKRRLGAPGRRAVLFRSGEGVSRATPAPGLCTLHHARADVMARSPAALPQAPGRDAGRLSSTLRAPAAPLCACRRTDTARPCPEPLWVFLSARSGAQM